MIILNGDVTLVPDILRNHELNVSTTHNVYICLIYCMISLIPFVFVQSEGVVQNKSFFFLRNIFIFDCLSCAYYCIQVHSTWYGLVLTFLARNVQIDVLDDYHYNTTIIIISSILLLADTPQKDL